MSRRSGLFAAIGAVLVLLACAVAYLFWPEPTAATPSIDSLDASVDKGQYLATIGSCKTCHTRKDAQPFAGGVRFQSAFGVLYSTNITSDPESGIGRWSFAD